MPWPPAVQAALEQLTAVVALLDELQPRRPRLALDLADLRGFDYYTGVRFAAYVPNAPDAVLRGGRYDELLGRYGRPAPATGFAIDLEAVAQAQRAGGVAAPAPSIGIAIHEAQRPALLLRASGMRVVTQATAPRDWGAWLRGAGLDAAVIGDRVIRADGSEVSGAAAAIEAALGGDRQPLIALITGT
jgi:ATP phosphoribosyltransferase regulatory subunit